MAISLAQYTHSNKRIVKEKKFKQDSKEMENKIAEASRHLNSIVQARESIPSEIQNLILERNGLTKQVQLLRNEIEVLDKQMDSARKVIADLDIEHSDKIIRYGNQQKDHIFRIEILKNEIEHYEQLAQAKFLSEQELISVGETVIRSKNELSKVLQLASELSRKSEIDKQNLEQEKNEWKERKLVLDTISTDLERKRDEWEAAVRLLQRWYNESGINMNILKAFNLKPLNE